MAFIGNQPTAVPLTSSQLADGLITTAKLAADAVTSAKILDSTIVNADIASTTINLTQKVTGTLPATNGGTGVASYSAGNILYASNATTLATLAPGTSGQALILNGTTPSWGTLGSDYVLLATTEASSSASVSFDGFYSSTYKNYKVIISYAIPASNNQQLLCRFRQSNADLTSSYYLVLDYGSADSANSYPYADRAWNQSFAQLLSPAVSSTADRSGSNSDVMIYNPLNTTSYKVITSNWIGSDQGFTTIQGGTCNIQNRNNTGALSGITFYYASGNIASGNFKLYGIK
jgi:hypothetical protein